MRTDIQFPSSEGKLFLRGWFYTPAITPAPCIVMAHGFSALKEHRLDPFAKAFCEAGFCVLVYDNRNFGDSDKITPLEVDPIGQIQDARNAVSYAQKRQEVIPEKIGAWGTSFSAGIMIQATAFDSRIRSIVAQVPMVNGWLKSLRLTRPDAWQKRIDAFNKDREQRLAGKPPEMVAVVSNQPEARAIMPQVDAYRFFTSVPKWPNEVTLRSLENSGEFEPHFHLAKITPRPILFIVARNDTVNTADLAAKAYTETHEPKKIVYIEGDHFSPYYEEEALRTCVEAAVSFFRESLQETHRPQARL